MIDLSKLAIPPVDVVPEPNEIDVRCVSMNINLWPPDKHDRVLCSLARRCRELEADLKTANNLVAAKERTAGEYRHASASNLLHIDRELKPRIAELEAEVERLKGMLVEPYRRFGLKGFTTRVSFETTDRAIINAGETWFPTEAAAWAAVRKVVCK